MTSEEAAIAAEFPALAGDAAFGKTSDASRNYNCIAFAAGDDTQWWWPPIASGVTQSGQYWPPWAPNEESVAAFVAAFEGLRYRRCLDAGPRPGYEKVAIYANAATGRPTHAAVQQADGSWKSKLGPDIDVRHSDSTGVAGQRYGAAVVYLERARDGARAWRGTVSALVHRAKAAVRGVFGRQ